MSATTTQPSADETLPAESEKVQGRPRKPLAAGEQRGRYVVLERVGQGGMGIVYAAYDPDLDRKVALKVLHPQLGGPEDRARLLGEAQLLARIRHPNVVAIHDVGRHEDTVFIAMEFLPGGTLKDWLDEERSFKETLDALLDAGQGLVAAHRSGLVHRDFKPENVLRTAEGRMVVTDFGLARASTKPTPAIESLEREGDVRLTRAGTVVGTPAYMSPEQYSGLEVDARTDVFSFCASAFEALYGVLPYWGQSIPQMAAAAAQGRVQQIEDASDVPHYVHEAILRGLSPDPHDRWPTMQALLSALRVDPGRARRRWLAGLGLAGVVGASLAGFVGPDPAPSCDSAGSEAADVWGQTQADTARAAFDATGLAIAPEVFERTSSELDAHLEAWATAKRGLCEAPPADAARRQAKEACLDVWLDEFAETVQRIEEADEGTVRMAVTAVLELPPIERCAESNLEPYSGQATELASVRRSIARARTLRRTGHFETAAEVAAAAAEEASQHDAFHVEAAARIALGHALDDVGDEPAALDEYGRAAALATRSGHTTVAAEAWARSVGALAKLDGLDEALRTAELANAAIERSGAKHLDQLVHNNVGNVYLRHNKPLLALEHYERARELLTAPGLHSHVSHAVVENNRGVALAQVGQLDEAKRAFEKSVQTRADAFAADPQQSSALINLARVYAIHDDQAKVFEYTNRALALQERAYGREHVVTAGTVSLLGLRFEHGGNLERAEELYREAVTTFERHGADENADYHEGLLRLGRLLALRSSYDEAQTIYEHSVAIQEKSRRTLGPNYAPTLEGLADAHFWKQNFEAAMSTAQLAVDAYERRRGAGPGTVADAHFELGRAALFAADYDLAVSSLEAALDDVSDNSVTRCRVRLAEAYTAVGRFEDARKTLDKCDECATQAWVRQRSSAIRSAARSGRASAPAPLADGP